MGVTKRIIELADTTTTDVGGAAYSGNLLSPAIWLKEIIDAAKKKHYAAQFALTRQLSENQKDLIIPLRTHYIGSGVANTWAGSAGQGVAVSYTSLNTLCGISLSPTDQNYGIAISNRAIRTNAVDVIREAREQLIYAAGDTIDREVFLQLGDDANRATSGARGSQAVLGGDATQASELAAGDTLTTDLIAKARRFLMSSTQQVLTLGTGYATATIKKNPWTNDAGEPFVFFIAPEQEEVLLTDGQFINASQYGSDKIIHNGEIGEYLGIKVVVTDNTPSFAASVTHEDGTTTAVAQHRCVMTKARKAVALAYGLQPRLAVFDFPSELEKRLVLEMAYAAKQLYSDAIVHVDVADD